MFFFLCLYLETSGWSVQHCQPAVHCQTRMHHRAGRHHKPGQSDRYLASEILKIHWKHVVVVVVVYFCFLMYDSISRWLVPQCGTNTQLLHVFQEDFILGYKPQKEEASAFTSGDGAASCHISVYSSLFTHWSRKEDYNPFLIVYRFPTSPILWKVLPGGDRKGSEQELCAANVAPTSQVCAGLCW